MEVMEDEIQRVGEMAFTGQRWLELAEANIPYIYSTKDPTYSRWTGGFNANADLTFGIGHSIKDAAEFNTISNFTASHNAIEIAAEVQKYLQSDLDNAVKTVNDFIKNNNVSLQQNQFDAIVCLVFNYPFALATTTDLGIYHCCSAVYIL